MEAINNDIGMRIPRNYFDLSQVHGFTCKAGYIYPIFQEILFPGDLIHVRNQCVIRQLPTINPSYSQFKVKFWDFVVAIRNLDKNIYRFLSGFEEYTNEVEYNDPLPYWEPSSMEKTRPGTLWDFLQNPINCMPDRFSQQLDYFRQAYGYIWDIYFRNEARQETILNEKHEPGSWQGEDLLRVNWDRDYLTTSLPKQQLGTPGGIPIDIQGSAAWGEKQFTNLLDKSTLNIFVNKGKGNQHDGILKARTTGTTGIPGGIYVDGWNDESDYTYMSMSLKSDNFIDNQAQNRQELTEFLNDNTLVIGQASTILISQLAEMIAIQNMNVTNAISGIRDDEFLLANWGVRPSNEALQYPDIFGRETAYIKTNEVLQTSQTTTDSELGDMGGHGISVSQGKKHKYYAKEFCIYLKLMYIKPETLYGKQASKRKFTQQSKYDFPFVQLNHISMQPVYSREILCASRIKPIGSIDEQGNLVLKDLSMTNATEDQLDNTATEYNDQIQGYQNNFAWYKRNENIISGMFNMEQYYDEKTGDLKQYYNLYNWTEARFFSIKDGERPQINNDFLQCKPDKRNYNLTNENDDEFLVWHNNIVDSWRSMSLHGMPSSLGTIGGY